MAEGRNDEVLTTFQAARYCRVSHKTIERWIDERKLPAYRTPGGHRRIFKRDLDRFLEIHRMPPVVGVEPLDRAKRILFIGSDNQLLTQLEELCRPQPSAYQIAVGSNEYEAGLMVGRFRPDLIVLDLTARFDYQRICKQLRKDPETRHIKVLAVAPDRESGLKVMAEGAIFFDRSAKQISLGQEIKKLIG